MTTVALIPARAGSKRLPGKNVRDFGPIESPLWTWTLNAACRSECFDGVWVSTDDPAIHCAHDYTIERGAPAWWLHERDPSDDAQTTEQLVQEWTALLGFQTGAAAMPRWSTLCILQPTSPLRTAEDIRHAFQQWEADDLDSLISVGPSGWGGLRSNGAIYITARDYWDRTHQITGGRVGVFTMPAERSIDIDTEEDWRRAEAML